MEDQAAARCGGIDVFGEGAEVHASGFQLSDDLYQVLHRWPETVKLPDRKRVAVPRFPESLDEGAGRPFDRIAERPEMHLWRSGAKSYKRGRPHGRPRCFPC